MKWLAGLILFASLVFFAGCGDNAGGKKAVSGTISFQSKPLDQGTISFFATGTPTPAAETLIAEGKYSIPAEQGLLPGEYLVKIRSTEAFPITPEEYAAGKTAPPARERIPEKYNEKSEQKVEVKTAGTNVFDYQIE